MRNDLWSYFGPLSWPFWALLLAAIIYNRQRRPPALRLAGFALVMQLLIGMPVVGRILISPLENKFPQPELNAAPDMIIMLAGAERLRQSALFNRPIFSEASERVSETAYLALRYRAAKIILVGGIRQDGKLDVDIARQYLTEMGIAPARIILIKNTLDTCSNATGVAALKRDISKSVLVTSAAHMPRAMACFAKSGLSPIAYPVDFRGGGNDIFGGTWFSPGSATPYGTFDLASHEWIGLLWYRLSGRIDALFV
jgi:uncharacterized SAM-binding protein YcdF (DUF218 family)